MYKVNKKAILYVASYYKNVLKQHKKSWTQEKAYEFTTKITELLFKAYTLPTVSYSSFIPDKWKGLDVRYSKEFKWYFAITQYKNGNSRLRYASHANLMSNLTIENGGTLYLHTKPKKYRMNTVLDDLGEELQREINQITKRLNQTKQYASVFKEFGITKYQITELGASYEYKGYNF